jgi:catechol 2,3-dioxygenase-like lactoylglutathione lyase family enzyme
MPFIYTGIRVRNLRRSLQFYRRVMGMKQNLKGRMMAGGIYVQLKNPQSGQRLELNYYPRGTKFHEKYRSGCELDHLAFWEKDVDRKYRDLIRRGAKKAVEPFSEDGYKLAFVKDPDGIWIELLGPERRAKL